MQKRTFLHVIIMHVKIIIVINNELQIMLHKLLRIFFLIVKYILCAFFKLCLKIFELKYAKLLIFNSRKTYQFICVYIIVNVQLIKVFLYQVCWLCVKLSYLFKRVL